MSMKVFWESRKQIEISDKEISAILEGYSKSVFSSYQTPLRQYLKNITNYALSADDHVRVLDIGCANGTVAYWLAREIPQGRFKYYGVDPWPVFINDARNKFPDQTFFVSDCEKFCDSVYREIPVGIHVSVVSGVFTFVSPEYVFKTLEIIKVLSDHLIIRDYFGHLGENYTGAFYHHEGFPMFAHDYQQYFSKLGMEILNLQESGLAGHDLRGFGTALVRT